MYVKFFSSSLIDFRRPIWICFLLPARMVVRPVHHCWLGWSHKVW